MKYNDRIPYKYRHDVHIALLAVAAAGPLGLMGDADTFAVVTAWGCLLGAMLAEADVSIDKETGKKLALAVITGAGGYYAGCKLATKIFWLIPGAGILLGVGISALANIIFTYRFAWVVAMMLEENKINKGNILTIAGEIAKNMTIGGGLNLSGAKDIFDLYRDR